MQLQVHFQDYRPYYRRHQQASPESRIRPPQSCYYYYCSLVMLGIEVFARQMIQISAAVLVAAFVVAVVAVVAAVGLD